MRRAARERSWLPATSHRSAAAARCRVSVVPLVHACVVWNNYLYRLQDAREVTSPEKTQRETRQCDSERRNSGLDALLSSPALEAGCEVADCTPSAPRTATSWERSGAYADERAPRRASSTVCASVGEAPRERRTPRADGSVTVLLLGVHIVTVRKRERTPRGPAHARTARALATRLDRDRIERSRTVRLGLDTNAVWVDARTSSARWGRA